MQGKLEVLTEAKTGKSLRVKIGGMWLGASLDARAKLHDLQGQLVEFTQEDKGYGPWLKSCDPLGMPPEPSEKAQVKSNGDRWYMPFVSNTVAHCISGGLITEPSQIALWAKAAKAAADEL